MKNSVLCFILIISTSLIFAKCREGQETTIAWSGDRWSDGYVFQYSSKTGQKTFPIGTKVKITKAYYQTWSSSEYLIDVEAEVIDVKRWTDPRTNTPYSCTSLAPESGAFLKGNNNSYFKTFLSCM